MKPTKKLIIFRKKIVKVKPQGSPQDNVVFSVTPITMEDLFKRAFEAEAEAENPTQYETKTVLEYVGMCDDLKSMAGIIRQSPLDNYVVFDGTLHQISVPIQVLIDGRSADTLEDEWVERTDVDISDDIKNLQIDERDAELDIEPRK